MKFGLGKHTSAIITGRHEPEGIRSLSTLYWRILLVSFFLIVTSILVYGILGLVRILHDLNATENVVVPNSSALNRTSLKGAVEGFLNRQSEFELLKKTPGKAIPDPSR